MPNNTWMTPANITMVNASDGLLACSVSTTSIATTMAAVGNAIRVGVPPNADAQNPTTMAPYMPAMAPSPVTTP